MFRDILKENIIKDFRIGCFNPANGETVTVQQRPIIEVDIPSTLVHRALRESMPTPFTSHPNGNTSASSDGDHSRATVDGRPFVKNVCARMVLPAATKGNNTNGTVIRGGAKSAEEASAERVPYNNETILNISDKFI